MHTLSLPSRCHISKSSIAHNELRDIRLYKTVFPNGLDNYQTPAQTPAPSRKPSTPSLRSVSTAVTATPPSSAKSGVFGRWGGSYLAPPKPTPPAALVGPMVDGPVGDLIVAGTAFGEQKIIFLVVYQVHIHHFTGFGLFNLVFSLLPAGVKGVVGFFGFRSDRRLALQALAVAAAKPDVHSVFAGLV